MDHLLEQAGGFLQVPRGFFGTFNGVGQVLVIQYAVILDEAQVQAVSLLVGFENPALCVGFRKAFSYTKKSSFSKMKMATNHFILKGGYPEWIFQV